MPDKFPSSRDFNRRTFGRVLLTTAFTSLTACDNTKRLNAIARLFWCDQERMDAIAIRLALGDRFPMVYRNSTGTQALFQASGSTPRVAAISVSEPARLLQRAALVSFWDDNLRIVAQSEDLKQGLDFGSGFIQKIPTFGNVGFSPGSKYYFVAPPDGPTTIYSASDPGVSISTVDFTVRKIYSKIDLLYVFGPDVDGTGLVKGILGRILRSTGGSWNREADFRIPRPWAAASPYAEVDFDQWADRLLCIDIRDEFGAKWFLYDLHSRALTDLGKAHTYAAFLDQRLVDRLAA